MVEAQEKRKVNHGYNIKTARNWKNVTQDKLGDFLNLQQSEISALEKKEVIDKKILDKIASFLDVDIRFLETFVPEDHMKSYKIDNSNFNNSEGATDNVVMGGPVEIDKQEINDNSLPFNEIKGFFEEIRKLEREIADLRVLLAKNGIEYEPKE